MKLRITALGGLMAVALLIVGCGGGGDDAGGDASASETITKAEFIKRADEICEQVDETQNAALDKYLDEHPDEEFDQALNEKLVLLTGIPPIQSGVQLLGELPVPSGDEDEVEAIVKGLEEAVKESEENPDAIANLKKGAGPFTEVGKLAGEYGLKACALPL